MRAPFAAATLTAAALLIGQATVASAGQIIIVNGNGPGVGFNDPTPAVPVGGNPGTTMGQQRLNVFQFAADIWESVLQPTTDIYVFARFVPLAPNVLGSAGPISVSRDFPGAEYPGTWYHAALANHLRGADALPHDPLDPNTDEISAQFSSTFAFYLGFDNNEGPGQNDLLPVLLHELGHGLGFSNLVNEATGTMFLGTPDLYSQYTLDVTTNKIWNAMTDAERAASALNLRKVSWSGVNVKKDVPTVLSPGEPFLGVNSPGGLGPFMFGAASFGPPLAAPGITGEVVLGQDGVAPSADACTPLVNSVAGKIVLVDRGVCTFTVKVKNAQDAGAIGVVVADNVAGGPPAGLGGADPTIVIPSGRVTLADGNLLKANLAGGLQATFGLDLSILAGTDRVQGLALLATFDPVALGSSISHFDGVAFRNLLMEPAINSDLTSSVTPPEDLTTSLFTDIGWFSDRDGVPDGLDRCIGSDTRAVVFVGSCQTDVPNTLFPDGCSIADELVACAQENPRRANYVGCVNHKLSDWVHAGVLTQHQAGDIQQCVTPRRH